MSKAKGKDAVVKQKHMPRKNGPCKKSTTGLHEPIKVARRTYTDVLSPGDDYMTWDLDGRRERYRTVTEHVYCGSCGKTGGGYERRSVVSFEEFRDQDETPMIPNFLDKLNAKFTKDKS